MKIRAATIFDHSAILCLLIEWFDESQVIKGYDDSACNWLSEMISMPHNMVLVAEYNDMIVGCLGLRTTCMPWNKSCNFLSADFIMTEKEYRYLGIGTELLREAKKVADFDGLLLLAGNSTGLDSRLKDKYFQMHGFKMLGSNFSYNGVK